MFATPDDEEEAGDDGSAMCAFFGRASIANAGELTGTASSAARPEGEAAALATERDLLGDCSSG